MFIHIHLVTVIVIISLVIIVNHLYSGQKKKAATILHHTLRFLYIVAILSGGFSLGMRPVSLGSLFKVFLGVGSIGLIEVYFMHKVKGDTPQFLPVFFVIFLSLTVVMGLFLPLGISLF
ncbi:DUF1516 family protein [Halobacillus amylolyticus]|uniref:DUF1516 family protein n=1 Tax=Halobacillus amylolyticus TaxID=2932259 RepID=A0ABY4HAI4_9BACI|nr:DUF1516 family protein [Halobacillus amylolyticus]UOR11890.1 DUF1516 family protein [Halobacillus amylolyticus]